MDDVQTVRAGIPQNSMREEPHRALEALDRIISSRDEARARVSQLEEARCPGCGEWVRDFPAPNPEGRDEETRVRARLSDPAVKERIEAIKRDPGSGPGVTADELPAFLEGREP